MELITDKKLEVQKGDIIEVNITDSLTKPLPNPRFEALRRRMGLYSKLKSVKKPNLK